MRHLAAFLTVVGLSVVGPSEAGAQSNSGLEMAKPESVGIPPNVFSTLDTRCNAFSTMVWARERLPTSLDGAAFTSTR